MKQKLFIFFALIFLLILLIGLNAASYVQKEKIPDSEDSPNRSTYNVGATGTRAFYDLLAETGRKVIRWQEPFPTSGAFDADQFSTFVIIGEVRREFEPEEIEQVLNWVNAGGTLVIIDREPFQDLIPTSSYWSITSSGSENSTYMVDPSDQTQMVAKAVAAKPIQPTIFTIQVNAVQPSQFASSINITRFDDADKNSEPAEGSRLKNPRVIQTETDSSNREIFKQPPPPPAVPKEKDDPGSGTGVGNREVEEIFKTPTPTPIEPITAQPPVIKGEKELSQTAPVIHLANKNKNLLVDFPYGAGQIVFLSDPYIVSNGGIKLVDNAQLALNIVDARQGIIAFDEYHQGYGRNDNRLFQYFAGTPVIAIFLQLFLIIGLLFYSQSRRFARALPDDQPNRLSKLEYVSAMAQLQGRTKAFDLAIENIYREFRRRVSRLFGIDNHTASRRDLAKKIAERLNRDHNEIEDLMYQCEDIMHGEPTKKKEIVNLISQLREVEEALGLRRGKKRNS